MVDEIQAYAKALGAVANYYSPSPKPLIWSNKVTYKCVCRCGFCPFWRMRAKELNTQQQLELIDQAAKLGVGFVAFEGGEPLCREDLPILLAHAKKKGMITALITNGCLFEQRRHEVIDSIDILIVSIDGPEHIHDALRGKKGVFRKAVACRKLAGGKRFFFNAVLNEKNFAYVEDIVNIAEQNRTMVSFCPAFSYSGADDLRGGKEDFLAAISKLQSLKRKGKPIMNSNAFFEHILSGGKLRCVYPRLFMNTNPEGRLVYPCPAWEGRYTPKKDVTNGRLAEEWGSRGCVEFRAGNKRCATCEQCHFIDSTEASLILRGKPLLLLEYMGIWRKIRG